jgi:nitroreductase
MEFAELIEKRYSSRAYKPDPVEQETLNRVLQAAIIAPTAADKQPFRLIVIHTKGKETDLKRIYDRDWFIQAPIVICACGVPEEAWVHRNGKNHCEIDVTIAMDHLTLAAANEELGTCWIAAFNQEAARAFLKLPENVDPLFFTPLGYPADMPGAKERKAMEEIVRYEHW